MATNVKRRYKNPAQPEFRYYSEKFDKLLIASDILNGGQPLSVYTKFWDEGVIKTELAILESSTIPARKDQLAAIERAFESYSRQRQQGGYDPPTRWPDHLLRQRCECEARIDIAMREAEFLRDKLETKYLEPARRRKNDQVLMYGPLGSGRLQGGVLVELDGQTVDYVQGELVITEPSSPYKGMKISDYRRHVVEPWKRQKSEKLRELVQRRKKELAETGKSNTAFHTSSSRVSRLSLPPWPEGIKNYFEATDETESDENSI